MLSSMTGFGSGRAMAAEAEVRLELRSVNHRHLKLQLRGPEGLSNREPELESLLRSHLTRGMITATIQLSTTSGLATRCLNLPLAEQLWRETESLCQSQGRPDCLPGVLAGLLTIPGMVSPANPTVELERYWPLVLEAFQQALQELLSCRRTEGAAIVKDLRERHAALQLGLGTVREHQPQAIAAYRERLLERMRATLGELGRQIPEEQILREVALFADRTDIHEEVHRLTAHLEQFATILEQGAKDSPGRRLEFLVQEIGREVNTLGSKAADVTLSRVVFDLKSILEAIRENLANLE